MKLKLSFVILLFLLGIVAFNSIQYFYAKNTTDFSKDHCFESFNKFAYSLPNKDATANRDRIPLSPWKEESKIPNVTDNTNIHYVVALTRPTKFHTEIWVRKYVYSGLIVRENYVDQYQFLIYSTDTKEWKTISAEIKNTGMVVDHLYLTSTGSIWGRVISDNLLDSTIPTPLARFNEISNRFELVMEASDAPAFWKISQQNTVNYPIWKDLSVVIGLIITNCIVMGRLEAYAMANKPWKSFLDGLGNGVGYSIILIIVAAIRELFGKGSLLDFKIIGPTSEYFLNTASSAWLSWYTPNNLLVLSPAAMFIVAIIIWVQRSKNTKLVDIS